MASHCESKRGPLSSSGVFSCDPYVTGLGVNGGSRCYSSRRMDATQRSRFRSTPLLAQLALLSARSCLTKPSTSECYKKIEAALSFATCSVPLMKFFQSGVISVLQWPSFCRTSLRTPLSAFRFQISRARTRCGPERAVRRLLAATCSMSGPRSREIQGG